jgi:hypothetical protein
MTTTFNHSTADAVAMATAARIAGGDSLTTDVARAARVMARGIDSGMTGPQVGAIFGLSAKVSERIAYLARLGRMVDTADDDTAAQADACLTMLSNSGAAGRSIASPVRVLKRWQREGTAFVSWAAAYAALEQVYAEQNPATEETEEATSEEATSEKTEAERFADLVAAVGRHARKFDRSAMEVALDIVIALEQAEAEAADAAADAA